MVIDGEIVCFGTGVGLTGIFFAALSDRIFEVVVPGAWEACNGFFPEVWEMVGALVVDPPVAAFLFIEAGGGETPPVPLLPPPRCREDGSRLCTGMAGTTILDSPTSFTRASNPAS